jgi:hypothetical protein
LGREKLPAYFAIAAGLGIVAWWLVDLTLGNATGRLTPQGWFHVAAEAITALALLLAGSRVLQNKVGGRRIYLAAAGMLIYATVAGAGTFAARGQWAMAALLLAVAAATVSFAVETGRAINSGSR